VGGHGAIDVGALRAGVDAVRGGGYPRRVRRARFALGRSAPPRRPQHDVSRRRSRGGCAARRGSRRQLSRASMIADPPHDDGAGAVAAEALAHQVGRRRGKHRSGCDRGHFQGVGRRFWPNTVIEPCRWRTSRIERYEAFDSAPGRRFARGPRRSHSEIAAEQSVRRSPMQVFP